MLVFFSTIHVLLCVFMIFVILLQPGKDAGMGAALGGGAATSAFGGRGAVTFLSKVTAATAVAFFLTSLGLSFVGLRKSVGESEAEKAASAPVVPGGTPAPTDGTGPAAPPAGEAKPADPAGTPPGAPSEPPKAPGAGDAVPADKLPPTTP